MTAPALKRRLMAEGLGTALLVATVVGSGIMAERLSADVGLQLLANTLPTVAILFVLITLLGPISGAHFNPVVSLVMLLRREMGWREFAAYIGLQCVGAVLGALLAHAMFALPLVQLSAHGRNGPSQWLSEGVAAFGLLLTILLGRANRPAALPALVACFIGAAYWFTASTSFANPAVTLARSLTDTFSGIAPTDMPAFVVSQLAGGLVALAVAGRLGPYTATDRPGNGPRG